MAWKGELRSDCGRRLLLSVVALLLHVQPSKTGGVSMVNPYIADYQPLNFDHGLLQDLHRRVRRSLEPSIFWDFHAYDRHFQLVLQSATSVFAEGHVIKFGSEPASSVDTSFVYEGHIKDVPGSRAHVSITKAGVSGHIHVPGDTTYHIEPARHYFNDSEFHTIIYPESKFNFNPFRHIQTGPNCGNDKWSQNIRNLTILKSLGDPSWQQSRMEPVQERYQHTSQSKEPQRNRHRRQVGGENRLDPTQSRCSIHMQADKLLYDYVLSGLQDDPDLSKEQRAREEVLSLFANHVTSLTTRFQDVEFQATDQPDVFYKGIKFQIQRTTIITSCESAEWSSGYCSGNLDVGHFLELTASKNQNDFCLSYFFTYRNFLDGTLGLAYVARPSSSFSGVCGRFSQARTLDGRVISISQNTGIVTLEHFRARVPLAQSQLTFMHEVGHNFGAEHDEAGTVCAPFDTNFAGAQDGNFVMFPTSADGTLANNFLFSSCSKNYIFNVLDTFADRGVKFNCFTSPDQAVCGNTVVETGEACDCGYEEDCATVDACCVPAGLPGQCNFTANQQCSPSAGLCCKNDCTFFPDTRTCREESECYKSASCTGLDAICPESELVNYTKFCDSYTHTCKDGECIGSVCAKAELEECYPTMANGATDSEMCHVACLDNITGQCISTLDPTMFARVLGDDASNASPNGVPGVPKPPGSPCNAFVGYCDSESVCYQYDSEGPFKKLVGEIFTSDSWEDVQDWIEDQWWVMLIILVGTVVGLGLMMKFCSYHTPSQDPKKPQPRSHRQPGPNRAGASYAVEAPNNRSNVSSTRPERGQGRPASSTVNSLSNNGRHVDRLRQGSSADSQGRPVRSFDNPAFQGDPLSHGMSSPPSAAYPQGQTPSAAHPSNYSNQPDFPAYVSPSEPQFFYGAQQADRPPSYRTSEQDANRSVTGKGQEDFGYHQGRRY